MKIWAIEGNSLKLDGGAMFGNAPKQMWSGWVDSDEKNRILLATRAMLVQSDAGKNILFETGVGAYFSPELKARYAIFPEHHQLLTNLEKVGIPEEKIDFVVLSHLHFDHAGGLLSAYGKEQKLHFPNAKYVVGKKHYLYSKNPHPREKASFIPQLPGLLEASGRLVLLEDTDFSELGIPHTFHLSHGHTQDLMMVEIDDAGTPVVFISDLVPGMAWVHLPIAMGYDRFAELKVDEKKSLYDDLVKRGAHLFFTHDPEVFRAALLKNEKGKYICQPV